MADVSILGEDAVRGDAQGMAGIGRFLDDTAEGVERIRTQLGSSTLGNNWEGAASQAFAELVDDLPDMLTKAHRSYALAASTVQDYARELRDRQDTARTLAQRLEDAQHRLSAAGAASTSAGRSVSSARSTHLATSDPAARAHTQRVLDDALRAAADAQRAFHAVRGEIDHIKDQARDNRRALDSAAARARELLSDASHLGMRNSVGSFFRRHVAPVAGAIGHALVKTFVDALSIGNRLVAFIQDPSWKNLSAVMESVAALATIVALVAVIVLSGGSAAPAALAVLTWSRGIALAAGGAKLAIDTGRYAGGDQEVTPLDLAVDAVALGFSARGVLNTRAVSASFGGAGSAAWQTRYLRYGTSGLRTGGTEGLVRPTVGGTAFHEAVDYAVHDGGFELIKHQARDLTPGDRNWFLSPRPFEHRIDNLLTNGATQIRRTFPMPVIDVPPPAVTPAPQEATP
jgi:hypothetical protein